MRDYAARRIVRAAIAGMVAVARRGTVYGVFNAVYRSRLVLRKRAHGLLYDVSLVSLVVFSLVSQMPAIPILFAVGR